MQVLPRRASARPTVDCNLSDGEAPAFQLRRRPDGVFTVSSTLGQPAASAQPMANGNFSLIGGFWSLLTVQTPGTPWLNIARSNALAIVSWPFPSTGFELQQNTDLNAATWTTPSETVTDNSTTRFITVSPALGNHFYRLFKP